MSLEPYLEATRKNASLKEELKPFKDFCNRWSNVLLK